MSPKPYNSTNVCWTELKQIWSICFRDNNGNCVGRYLQTVFWNESPSFASTDKLVSKYSGAYPKLSKLPSWLADACLSLNNLPFVSLWPAVLPKW